MRANFEQVPPDYTDKKIELTFKKVSGTMNILTEQSTIISVNERKVGEILPSFCNECHTLCERCPTTWKIHLRCLKHNLSAVNKYPLYWKVLQNHFSTEAEALLYVKENIRAIAQYHRVYLV